MTSEALARCARWFAAVVLALALPPVLQAAVPHEDAVPAYAEEQTILQAEKDVPEPGWWSRLSGRNHLDRHYLVPLGRDAEQHLILQRGGNTWRVVRNGPLATFSAVLLLLTLAGIAAVWKFSGPARLDQPETGRRMQRFTAWQRLVHWSVAIAFLLLALTGLLILFGKQLLIPLIGHAAFSWLALASKYLHNVAGPLFIVLSVVMFFTFLRDNHFHRSDWQWLRRMGRAPGGGHVPAGFFNAGEKLWFWTGVVLLGLLMAASGLVLDFVNFRPTRYMLQWANYLHLAGATLYMALALGHIYLGTLGTPGAYTAMRRGDVDESWARTHHREWYEHERGRDTSPRGGAGATP